MKLIMEFDKWKPDQDQVEFWGKYLDMHYPVKEYQGMKIILIDEKIHYLSDPLLNKKWTVTKIVSDIKHEFDGEIHEPSLRRAIKFWIDSHNYLEI